MQPFTTGQAHVFFGRERDTAKLYRMVRREPLVVLYGKSGLGKSSLLNAGIIPECHKIGELTPITIRFGAWTEDVVETPLEITKKIISDGFATATFLDRLLPDDTSLWYHAKTRQLNGGGQPLLIFDQFEELFTYPEEAIRAFKEELSELLHTGIPLRFRRMAEPADFLTDEDEDRLEEPLEVRHLFAIRSDRMHLLHQLADWLPGIFDHMYKLQALQKEDAKRAILLPAQAVGEFRTPPFEWTPTALSSLLAFLQDPENEQRVEGILLQLLCQYFEEKKVEQAGLTRLDADDLGDLEKIVEQYYFEKIASLGGTETQLAARRLIEEGLVLEGENIRLSLHEAQIIRQFKVDHALLEKLVNSRLLRAEPFLRGGYSYELAHDRLVPPVLAAKQQRRAVEAEQERLRKDRELEEARKKAAEEQHLREQAEAGERRARQRTLLAALLSVIAIGVAIWAFSLKNKAQALTVETQSQKETIEKNLEELSAKEQELQVSLKAAQIAKDTAEAQRIKAELATLEAEKAKTEAEANLDRFKVSSASYLTSEAKKAFEKEDIRLAWLLTEEALKKDPSNADAIALKNNLPKYGGESYLEASGYKISPDSTSIVFFTDGKGDTSRTLNVLELGSGSPPRQFPDSYRYRYSYSYRYSGDGQYLQFLKSDRKQLVFLDLEKNREAVEVWHQFSISNAAFINNDYLYTSSKNPYTNKYIYKLIYLPVGKDFFEHAKNRFAPLSEEEKKAYGIID